MNDYYYIELYENDIIPGVFLVTAVENSKFADHKIIFIQNKWSLSRLNLAVPNQTAASTEGLAFFSSCLQQHEVGWW